MDCKERWCYKTPNWPFTGRIDSALLTLALFAFLASFASSVSAVPFSAALGSFASSSSVSSALTTFAFVTNLERLGRFAASSPTRHCDLCRAFWRLCRWDAEFVHCTLLFYRSRLNHAFQRRAQQLSFVGIQFCGVVRLEVFAKLREAGSVSLLEMDHGIPDQGLTRWGCHGVLHGNDIREFWCDEPNDKSCVGVVGTGTSQFILADLTSHREVLFVRQTARRGFPSNGLRLTGFESLRCLGTNEVPLAPVEPQTRELEYTRLVVS